jgi:hypothetical protein
MLIALHTPSYFLRQIEEFHVLKGGDERSITNNADVVFRRVFPKQSLDVFFAVGFP